MANKPKQKGTTFETACVKMFKVAGIEARRLALGGANDLGDLEVKTDEECYIVECKCYKGFSRGKVEEWRHQACTEAVNYKKAFGIQAWPVLIVSQHGKSNNDSYAHFLSEGEWMQMYLDEFIRMLKEENYAS